MLQLPIEVLEPSVAAICNAAMTSDDDQYSSKEASKRDDARAMP